MRNILSRAVTPALAVITISAALTAAARPILATPQPPSSPLIVTTAQLAPAPDPAVATLTARRHPPLVAPPAPASWTVRAGDTLTSVAEATYGTASAWYYLQLSDHLTTTVLAVGQALKLPAPRSVYPKPPAVSTPPVAAATDVASQAPPSSSGIYSYSGLEALWEANGGSSGVAATAACIAEHESSGNPDAFNGTDIGLWQIDPGNEPGADLYDASVNAAEAVRLSADGTNWSDWQTAPDCGV